MALITIEALEAENARLRRKLAELRAIVGFHDKIDPGFKPDPLEMYNELRAALESADQP